MGEPVALDHRRNAFRPDLADARLKGRVSAGAFVEGAPMQVAAASAPLHREPRPDAGLDTEALCGERVSVFEVHEGWAWVQLAGDGYVGYTPADRLGPPGAPATHRVATPRTYVYPGDSIKLPHVALLSLGARLCVVGTQGAFAVVAGVAGLARAFVWSAHLAPLSSPESDPVTVAERLLHTPYLWGGKQSLGLDCSGLVQVVFDACGMAAPRDSDMQEREIALKLGDNARALGLQRGDLVFWKGHVGLMQDGQRLIHANGHHMQVASEPLEEAVRRIAANGGGPVTSITRPASGG
jgi:cell wall-associated NlpC family hydrolase